jgi:hypothetical protein
MFCCGSVAFFVQKPNLYGAVLLSRYFSPNCGLGRECSLLSFKLRANFFFNFCFGERKRRVKEKKVDLKVVIIKL